MKHQSKLGKGVIAAILFSGLLILNSCNNASDNKIENKEKIEAEIVTEEIVNEVIYDTNSAKSMVEAVAAACGGMDRLKALKDVQYDYHYIHPDGKEDISLERYIFDQEVAWARYTKHEINVIPEAEGDVVQFFDGEKAMVYNGGEASEDPKILGTGQFLRQANYMWFTMMFKLTDPGTVHEYNGREELDGKIYDVVTVSYDPAVTGKEQNDTYILYINPETHLVENFKFSLPAFNVAEPVLFAKVTYKEVDGIQVMSRREMFAPSPEGGMTPMVDEVVTNIKFNNGFTSEGLSKEI